MPLGHRVLVWTVGVLHLVAAGVCRLNGVATASTVTLALVGVLAVALGFTRFGSTVEPRRWSLGRRVSEGRHDEPPHGS